MTAQRLHYGLLGWLALLALFLPRAGLTEPLDHWRLKAPLAPEHFLRISYGNGVFVSAGEGGTLHISSDGETWTQRNSGANQSLRDVCYGGGTFVAVGEGGTILSSADGVTWTRRGWAPGYNLHGVGNGRNTFVAVGDQGMILTSSNGSTWVVRNSGTHQGLKKVVYGNGTFVAVGDQGTLLTSPDGAAWTERDSGTRGNLQGIAFGRETFVATGEAILVSPDGIQWTERATGTKHRLFGVAYGKGIFAAAADNGAILTSPNGSEWTVRDSRTHLNLYGIAYGNDKFLVSGEKGVLLHSELLRSPGISVSPGSLDFGSVHAGNSSFTNLTISNSGSDNLIIRQITLSGADSLDFSTRNDGCTGTTLSPSQNCTIQIVFSPRSTGSKSAALSISSNDPDTPIRTVSLSGTGTDGGILISSGSTGSFCFISTSVKGLGFEDYLDILRKFRDTVLMRSHWGRKLVNFYYRQSPALNELLAGSGILRKAVAIGFVHSLAAFAYFTIYASPAEKAVLFFWMAGAMTAGWRLIRNSGRKKRFMIGSPVCMQVNH